MLDDGIEVFAIGVPFLDTFFSIALELLVLVL